MGKPRAKPVARALFSADTSAREVLLDDKARINGHLDNRLLASLPVEAITDVARDLRQISIAQGAALYEPGDAIDTIYFPQSGVVSLLIVTESGGTIETSVIGREGVVGLHRGLGTRRSFTRATVQIGGKFSAISGARFEELVRDYDAVRKLIERHSELAWTEGQQLAACNAAHDAPERLAHWLLHCADRSGSETLPLTQELLAQMLSVRRTTVTLLAQALQREGVIRYSRGRLTILDREKLKEHACECYSIIRDDKLPILIGMKS